MPSAPRVTCPWGHSYDEQNTYVNPKTGQRLCRACQRSYQSKRRRRNGPAHPINALKTHCPRGHQYQDEVRNKRGARICLECNRARDRERLSRPSPPGYARRRYLKNTHGITEEQYDQLLEGQAGLCAGCGCSSIRRLHVDHNHRTGQIRGLLCFRCNAALGLVDDDPSRLRALAEYLEA